MRRLALGVLAAFAISVIGCSSDQVTFPEPETRSTLSLEILSSCEFDDPQVDFALAVSGCEGVRTVPIDDGPIGAIGTYTNGTYEIQLFAARSQEIIVTGERLVASAIDGNVFAVATGPLGLGEKIPITLTVANETYFCELDSGFRIGSEDICELVPLAS